METADPAGSPVPPRKRPTLGLLTSRLDRGFHRAALMRIAEGARASGANLICFDGGVLAPAGTAAAANALYDLVGPAAVDGLIIWASALDWIVDATQMDAFCRRFSPLPVVSVGRAFAGIPSVLVDNYQGMRDAVSHLIEDHGYRRIAFLRGPKGAQEEVLRFRAYRDALTAHNLPVAAELISGHTSWARSDGPAAIADFLDARRLRPKIDFEAIVSVGDDMACGALEMLQMRGILVPDDVAVVGFNDDDEGRAILPALTTVRQPVEEMAHAAVSALLALLPGQPAAEIVTLPLKLVVRRSCGCLSPGVLQAAARAPRTTGRSTPRSHAALVTQVVQATGAPAAAVDRLIADLHADLASGSSGAFIATLDDLVQRAALAGQDVTAWHAGLSAVRGGLLPTLTADAIPVAEDLWQQGRVLVGETAAQARAYQRFRAEQDTRLLGDLSQRIQTAAHRSALFETLAAELPALGVSACYLALHEESDDQVQMARLAFAFDRNGVCALDPEASRFPAALLLPPNLQPVDAPHGLVVLPLYFQNRQLGFLLLAVDARGAGFSEVLREQISTALAGLFLREQIRRAWQEAEDANRLKSRFLATVSHELRTPLSLIVGTIEMMQRDAKERVLSLPEGHRRDLASIHASAQHLAHLIADVLDLASSQAGELRLSREPLALADLLARVIALAEPMVREKGLTWETEFPERLPLVWGDRTRLQQVILNLVSNAVKFTEQGSVSLWVEIGKKEAVIAVSDTGMGIPFGEQETIFNEFKQSERTARRGYGGMGLGLAISRRLVELHGGQIGVLSTGSDGAGSTFYFTLPILAGEAGDPYALGERAQTVVVLTRQPGEGIALSNYLLGRGFVVETVAISEEPGWLERILAAPPGAVVLEQGPATERGWDLVQQLKRDPATSEVPVLFYNLPAEGDAGAALTLDHLAKPLGGDDLVQALRRQGIEGGRGKRQTILLVDDDPAILALHARVVQAQIPGCRVLRASDGAEALGVMAHTRPDLVLLDLMMPVMDGFAVLEAMREDERLRAIPVIVLTAQLLRQEEMARLQQGVAAVLSKELFTPAEVLAQVEAALARTKRLGSEPQRLVRLVMAYIHEHYAEPISREDLARHFCVNERYLTRCFHQETGVTPIAYLIRYRIQQAKILLEAGQLSVTDVGLATGFSDGGYFGRVFQKEVGITPGAYRRGLRAASSQ
jgi:signal transduction histidine kinase/DNA-binding LacI/PurR family transcriptional regulator/CheY-like chemotaxis protein